MASWTTWRRSYSTLRHFHGTNKITFGPPRRGGSGGSHIVQQHAKKRAHMQQNAHKCPLASQQHCHRAQTVVLCARSHRDPRATASTVTNPTPNGQRSLNLRQISRAYQSDVVSSPVQAGQSHGNHENMRANKDVCSAMGMAISKEIELTFIYGEVACIERHQQKM